MLASGCAPRAGPNVTFHVRGFRPLPSQFFFALAGIVACYLVLIEIGKYWFYRSYRAPAAPAPRHRTPGHRLHRRAARFAIHTLPPIHRHNAGSGAGVTPDSPAAGPG